MGRRALFFLMIMVVLTLTGIAWAGTEGAKNTFYGQGAGANTTGDNDYDTFIGADAGNANTTGSSNTFLGYRAGYSNTTGYYNTFLGYRAGYSNTTGFMNTFLGSSAGNANTTGNFNTFLGYYAGNANTTGYDNTFVGKYAGNANTTGYDNTFVGNAAGNANTTGNYNTFLGQIAGNHNTTGSANTFLGFGAGRNATGSANVFLGYAAGYNETGSNKLYIDNTDTATPLIYGEFNINILAINGKVGIGKKPSAHPLEMASGAHVTTGGVWTNASSREYKEDVEALSRQEAFDTLEGLNPVKFAYKADRTERHVGFIAEDVPELVSMKDQKGLSPMDIVAVLTKVVQEQQEAIQAQQKTIQELTDKVIGLERELKRR
ncbi:MAG: hypothetical protein A2Y65_11120 [Deltaproteobacteria bacterium RBG_13_52_11]|nr:MAG: hypothetical protein A2Y65_11120 [Deltaproteobacteria bacterium RBG_13_52_11]